MVLVEGGEPGGAARSLVRMETLPGTPVGLSGEEWVARSVAQARRFGATLASGCEAAALEVAGQERVLRLRDGREVRCPAVVAATGERGWRRRSLRWRP